VLLPPLYTSDKASILGRYGENLENGIRVLYAIHEHNLSKTIQLGNLNYVLIKEFFISKLSLKHY